MKLTPEQQKKAIEVITPQMSVLCDICSNQDWVLNDRIFELREFQGGNLVIGGQSAVFPVIALSCRKCGKTFFFNALVLGLIEINDEPKQ